MKLKIFGFGVLVLVLLCLLAAAGGFVWLRGSGRPVRGGEHAIPGLQARVAVRWDRWGVPHVAAEREQDLAAALGFLHANDRFTQMELGRRAAFGRLSELFGESMLQVDVNYRTLRLGQVAEAMWESSGPRAQRWFAAYATGVNAWLAARAGDLPPGLRLLGAEPEPWEPAHSMAFALLMMRDLSFWNDRPEEKRFQWLREYGAVRVRELLGAEDLHLPEAILALAREGKAPAVLAAAWRQGRGRWGDDVTAWNYGEIHALILRHRLDAVPAFGAWLRRGPFEVPGSATTVGLYTGSWQGDRQQVSVGASMRWVVDWSQPEHAFSVMPGGQSGHPADPHYDDQLADFLAGRLHPAPVSEEAIRAATVSEMEFLPLQ